jgi:O-antigen/teichoic acid export membrane protein
MKTESIAMATPAQSDAVTVAAPSVTRGLGRALAPPTRRWTLTAAWSVIDQAIVSGASFATGVMIGRACSKEDLGVYSLALTVVLIVRAIQSDLVTAPYMVYCNRREGEELASYAGSTLLHQILLSLLTVVGIAAAAAALTLAGDTTGLAPVMVVMIGSVPLILLRCYIRDLTFAHFQWLNAVIFDTAIAVLQLGALGLLAYHGALTVGRAYAVMGGACAVACAAWLLADRPAMCLTLSRAWADWRHNWLFGRWAVASQLVGRAATLILPWLLAAIDGAAAVGLLAACTSLVNLTGTFVTGVSNYLTPKAARAYAEGGPDALLLVLRRTAALFAATVGPFCLLILLSGDLAVVLVFGQPYAGAGVVLLLLALSTLANSIGITVGNGLWALHRPRASFVADAFTLGVTVVVMLGLVYPLGVTGAAVAILAGALTGMVVRCMRFFRLLRAEREALAMARTAEE